MQREHRPGIEAYASGIPKLAAGTWRELISSPQPPLAELIISSRHFWAGSRHQHVAAFPWGARHLSAADAHGTHKLAAALAGGTRTHDAPMRNTSHIPIVAVAGRTSKLTASAFLADCRQQDSGACTHGHRSWALSCIHEHAARRLPHRDELCVWRMWSLHAMKTPVRHRDMCEWTTASRR